MELCRRRHNSKERRLEPQITIGLLTDARGFPLMVEAFEGNRAETTTIIPSIQAFQAAHQLPEVTGVFPKKWRRDLCREFVDVSES